jgi:hypothetical protein
MPRILTSTEDNELKIDDRISGTDIVLYYRMPTPKERVDYQNALFRKVNGKVVSKHAETRVKNGLMIMTGFRAGDFLISDRIPLTTDMTDWKDRIKERATDLVELLAMHVFENSCGIARPVDDDIDDAGDDGQDDDTDQD